MPAGKGVSEPSQSASPTLSPASFSKLHRPLSGFSSKDAPSGRHSLPVPRGMPLVQSLSSVISPNLDHPRSMDFTSSDAFQPQPGAVGFSPSTRPLCSPPVSPRLKTRWSASSNPLQSNFSMQNDFRYSPDASRKHFSASLTEGFSEETTRSRALSYNGRNSYLPRGGQVPPFLRLDRSCLC